MEHTKYEAIAQWAMEKIQAEGLLPGDRFYSENEICEAHGVSRQTVRQALAILEQKGVLQRKRGSGTYVANNALPPLTPEGTNHNIGVISTYFSDYIFPGIITGIEQVLSENGYGMQLAITGNKVQNEEKALLNMLEQRVSGLIVEPTKSALPSPNAELYREIKARGIPLVFFNAQYPWADFPLVAIDDVMAGRLATQCLLDAGHKDVAAFLQLDDYQGHLRYKGYMQSMAAAHRPVDTNRVIWYATEDFQDLFAAPERILARIKGCTGIVCYNDQLAFKLLEFCKAQGIEVPRQLSIVGIDNAELSSLCDPPLTTVAHPMQQLGAKVAQGVLALVQQPAAKVGHLFEPKLIERASVFQLG